MHQRIAQVCETATPVDQDTSTDTKRRSRDETRVVEVFDPDAALAGTEWADYVGAIVRVSRTTHKRVTATGLWDTSIEIAYFVCEFLLPAVTCAHAIRHHWGIENRSHYVRDGSFREDHSRIRCNPGIFARLRSFAANILRFNKIENITDARYRISLGGLDALAALQFM